MKQRSVLSALLVTMALGLAAAAPVARADAGDISLDMLLMMGDRNKDRMLSKQEFIEVMGKAFDMQMAKVKKMPDAAKYTKDNALTRDALQLLFGDAHKGA
jgi:hypothetical protein